MDAIILSDIHLGAPNCQAKLLCEFLKEIRDNIRPQYLIINGDLFDSFDARLRKWHWEVLTNLRKLSNEIRLIWVRGNHDRDGPAAMVAKMLGTSFRRNYFIFTSGNKKILCTHGDRWDSFITTRPVLTWCADFIYWALQTIDPSFFLAKLAKRSSKTFLHNMAIVREGALGLMDRKGCDYVCVGHCHHATAEDIYFNSGCWTENLCTYLRVSGGKISLETYVSQKS